MIRVLCQDLESMQWCTWFGVGRTSLDDEPKPGRPKTSINEENTSRVDELIKCDRRMTIRKVALKLEIPKSMVHEIVYDTLEYQKVSARRHLGGMALETEGDLVGETKNWFAHLDRDFFRVGVPHGGYETMLLTAERMSPTLNGMRIACFSYDINAYPNKYFQCHPLDELCTITEPIQVIYDIDMVLTFGQGKCTFLHCLPFLLLHPQCLSPHCRVEATHKLLPFTAVIRKLSKLTPSSSLRCHLALYTSLACGAAWLCG
ncbi:histone-lysine N-methyltransferase SETMAR [Elysia marginata]|uniref:Histone-lysine N-methyltransferase SETMAR n=1 Tax=Elysia marginata TaxID=1093978 RepID=A0AAV4FF70_9GAST|nr:histone-lysine N-methyltransferase SETMAR [Elysia marginata]